MILGLMALELEAGLVMSKKSFPSKRNLGIETVPGIR